MKNNDISRESEPRVVVCLYDLVVWFMKHTNRFPKNWRFTLGDRIDNLLLETLAMVHRARLRSEKRDILNQVSENLDVLRVMARLCRDMECIELRQYEYAAKQMDEIGKQLGGWMKQQDAKKK